MVLMRFRYSFLLWMALGIFLTGCRAKPIFQRAGGVNAPKPGAAALVYPVFRLTNGAAVAGGGAVVVHWGRQEGVMITAMSNFARFYPGKIEMTGFDAAAVVADIELSTSVDTAGGTAGSPESLGSLTTLRSEADAAGSRLDVSQDLLAARVKTREEIPKLVLAIGDPNPKEHYFLMAWGGGGSLEKQAPAMYDATVLAITPYGLLGELPSSLDLKNASGFPLLNSAAEVVGILVRSYEEAGTDSKVSGYAEPTRFIRKAHFISARRIRELLEKVR